MAYKALAFFVCLIAIMVGFMVGMRVDRAKLLKDMKETKAASALQASKGTTSVKNQLQQEEAAEAAEEEEMRTHEPGARPTIGNIVMMNCTDFAREHFPGLECGREFTIKVDAKDDKDGAIYQVWGSDQWLHEADLQLQVSKDDSPRKVELTPDFQKLLDECYRVGAETPERVQAIPRMIESAGFDETFYTMSLSDKLKSEKKKLKIQKAETVLGVPELKLKFSLAEEKVKQIEAELAEKLAPLLKELDHLKKRFELDHLKKRFVSQREENRELEEMMKQELEELEEEVGKKEEELDEKQLELAMKKKKEEVGKKEEDLVADAKKQRDASKAALDIASKKALDIASSE